MSRPQLFMLLGAVLLVMLPVLIYLPSLGGGFILDDNIYVTGNRLLTAPDGLYRFWFTTEPEDYWPVSNSTFWLEWRLWGRNAWGYHATNLMLHIVIVFLVWRVLWVLAVPWSWLAALVFAVHPVNVESVAWVSQLKSLLSMLFFLLSTLCFLRDERRRVRLHPWYWLSLLAFILSMLSKASAAVLPGVLLLILWWQNRRLTIWDFVRCAPFVLVAGGLVWVNNWFETHGAQEVIRHVNWAERFVQAGAAVWFYLSKALLPIDLIFGYPNWQIDIRSVLWWLPLAAVIAATALLWRRRNKSERSWGRILFVAWLYFCGALVPVLGFVDVGFMQDLLVGDHYQYTASIAVAAIVAAGLATWWASAPGMVRKLAYAVATTIVCVLFVLAWRQSATYASPATLYQTTIERNPDCWYAYNNLGMQWAETGQSQKAMECFQRATELKPQSAEAHNNLGNMLRQAGRLGEAIEQYRRAIALHPNFAEAQNNLGVALAGSGRLQEAIAQYQKTIEMYPQYDLAHLNLGIALVDVGQVQEAIDEIQRAIKISPEFAEAYRQLAMAYAQGDRSDEAIAAGKKGAEIARAQGQIRLAERIENWLADYLMQYANRKGVGPAGKAKTP